MSALICELCNSNDLVKENGVYVCQNCGTKYTVEEAKKLLGSVKIDKSEETEKLLTLARRARDANSSANAEKYYALVLQEEPNNWEASFFQVYFNSQQCKIIDIAYTARTFSDSLPYNLDLALELTNDKERTDAINTIIAYSNTLACLLAAAAREHEEKHHSVSSAWQECIERISAAENIYINLISALKNKLPTETKFIAETLKKQQRYFREYAAGYYGMSFSIKHHGEILDEIKKHDPAYHEELRQEAVAASKNSGCYVATAVYGSYDCPEVWTLRRYRDNTLAETWYGRAFIRTYYAVSPTLVKWFGDTVWFKKLWKGKLDRMVKNLQAQGYDSTPYKDKEW